MKALRVLLVSFVGLLSALLGAAGALWLWSGSDNSLAATLNQAARFLPAGQTLEVRGVKGSLRSGGSIAWLRWQQGELRVEASDLVAAWSAPALLESELRVERLEVGRLRIDDRRAATPTPAPTQLRLPLRVDLRFALAALEWLGPSGLELTEVVGHYRFDGQEHVLDSGRLRLALGEYSVNARLQASAPMALSAQLKGSVQTTLPHSGQTLLATAQAELSGQLGGSDAALELLARLAPEHAQGAAMQARAAAQIRPWQAQPIRHADLHWQSLDLAALWPKAPQTRLDGTARVRPTAAGWGAKIELSNALPGPWDLQRLPLDSLQSELNFSQGQWTLQSLQARAGGGRVQAQASLAGASAPKAMDWQGQATLEAINPAAIDSRLAGTRVNGRIDARQTSAGLAFDADLQATAKPPGPGARAGLRLKSLHAKGLWLAPALTFETLQLNTDEAQLQGQLMLRSDSRAAQGDLALTLPGAKAHLQGQIASASGQGELQLEVQDAAQLTQWLARWPGGAAALQGAKVQGAGRLSGQWHGGWQAQGRELQIQARAQATQLQWGSLQDEAQPGWRWRELQAEVSGTLAALALKVQAQLDHASRHFELSAQAQGGQLSDGVWQAALETARLSVQDSQVPGNWVLQLDQSVALRWRHSASSSALTVAPGSVHVSSPLSGAALLNWQPASWSRQGERRRWQTQGQLQGLPLAWIDLLGGASMNQVGFKGDALFDGAWRASQDESLHINASLERRSGDLLLQTDEATLGSLQAGLTQARLTLQVEDAKVTASLRWDSQNAGQAQADFSTRLLHQGEQWSWPVDAPLLGSLQATLPPLARWSRLAPPGWRLRGTMDAQAELSGTRASPQWQATLRAQDLGLSSVADGIELSQGRLRARVDGSRLEILEFSIGGAGRSGGQLSVKGAVDWLPAANASSALGSRLRMALEIQADALRVSAAADRRLVLSGQLSARLADARLTLRGGLKADQALFVLPEDSTPALDRDVVVRAIGAPRSATPSSPLATPLGVTPDILLALDLGEHFELRGHGISTRLGGKLELRRVEHERLPRLNGELRTLGGSYQARGQNLKIEKGVLRFDGPYDNPTLDVLAIRPNLQQRVGIRIMGSALAPIVQLYADPDLPDAEKLSWLVLGRASAAGGSEAAVLQQAAFSLLGDRGLGASGGLAQSLGLDELSLGSSATSTAGSTSTGSNAIGANASDTTVTLGKHLSRNFYVAYEHGVSSAMGTFSIFYQLSRNFTLRAQTGEQSKVDLILTLRYD